MSAILEALEFAGRHAQPHEQELLSVARAQLGRPFQHRVDDWLLACFGEKIARDKEERNHRFLEESLELVQALGCTVSEAHQLVDYTFGRPAGDPAQECGGVMVTLAALCVASGICMERCAEGELARIHGKIEQIRAKQAAKPKHSPLPAVEHEATLTPKQARALSSLLGQYQELLESAIDGELIASPGGKLDPPDPEIRRRLQRDRRRWRACEGFQHLLNPGPHVEP
jgi:hypothetical protein